MTNPSHPMWQLIEELEKRRDQARRPGDDRAIQRQRDRGKLLTRERVEALLDPGTFHEIDMLVFPETTVASMEGKKAHTDGVITGWGEVDGRRVYVFSQDPAVVGGSLGEAGGEQRGAPPNWARHVPRGGTTRAQFAPVLQIQ